MPNGNMIIDIKYIENSKMFFLDMKNMSRRNVGDSVNNDILFKTCYSMECSYIVLKSLKWGYML